MGRVPQIPAGKAALGPRGAGPSWAGRAVAPLAGKAGGVEGAQGIPGRSRCGPAHLIDIIKL